VPAETQAACLLALEQVTAMTAAAHAVFLRAFAAGKGYSADGAYSPGAWLVHQGRMTRAAARARKEWAARAGAHPGIAALLARGQISESWARMICGWTGQLPGEGRDTADGILAGGVLAGLGLPALSEVFARIRDKAAPPDPDRDQDGFADRSVRVETTFGGAGVITGDLSPECAAAVRAVLDALSAPAGAEDDRSHQERYHDALEEAMRRLLAAGLIPDRAGQPARAWAHVWLGDLAALEGSSALIGRWAGEVRGRWAAARAHAATAGGGDGAAWLDGEPARAFACDASLTPVVAGEVNYQALDRLIALCVELAGLDGPASISEPGTQAGGQDDPAPVGQDDGPDGPRPGEPGGPGGPGGPLAGHRGALAGHRDALAGLDALARSPGAAGRARDALAQAIIGQAVTLLSGPGGLASCLRTSQLGGRLAGPSLPLDIGRSRAIPPGIRQAIVLRARGHCEWPGGCTQPAPACQVHHLRHQAHGGPTSVKDCVLLCFFHHQVCIHQRGWTMALNPDGTTTARSPDKKKVLHSHGPPTARAG
jgi:Domain of unknown function (DUF222)